MHGSRASSLGRPGGDGKGASPVKHLQRLRLRHLSSPWLGTSAASLPNGVGTAAAVPLLSASPAFRNLFRNRANVVSPRVYRRTRNNGREEARYLRRFLTVPRAGAWLASCLCLSLIRGILVNYSFNLYHGNSRFYRALSSRWIHRVRHIRFTSVRSRENLLDNDTLESGRRCREGSRINIRDEILRSRTYQKKKKKATTPRCISIFVGSAATRLCRVY